MYNFCSYIYLLILNMHRSQMFNSRHIRIVKGDIHEYRHPNDDRNGECYESGPQCNFPSCRRFGLMVCSRMILVAGIVIVTIIIIIIIRLHSVVTLMLPQIFEAKDGCWNQVKAANDVEWIQNTNYNLGHRPIHICLPE